MGRKLAMPLLGILLWLLSMHCGTFASAAYGNIYPAFEDTIYDKFRLDKPKPNIVLKITGKDLNDSVSYGDCLVKRMSRLEASLGWSNIRVRHGTPAHGQLIENSATDEALEQGRAAIIAARASQHLIHTNCHRFTVNKQTCAKLITSYRMNGTPLESYCNRTRNEKCRNENDYRPIDGSCNNLLVSNKGKSYTPYSRLLFPLYLDGIMEVRRASNKRPLPSARFISTSLTEHMDRPDARWTLALMQWTQFIAHDMAHTVSSKMISSQTSIVCCDSNGYNLSPRYVHPLCLQIPIPQDDTFYSKYRTNCMSYVRSLPAIRPDCTFGPIEQMNQATHYLDGSHIYGNTKEKANSLRQFSDGRLLTSMKNGRQFLPVTSNARDNCQVDNEMAECYRAGDTRVNMHPHLTAMHTFWTREHNRIASILNQLNPKWSDERLYQESRHIVIGQIQHITYTQWLPIMIGKQSAQKIQIRKLKYNSNVDPSVSNSFATVALRFMTSLMDSYLRLYEENRRNASKVLRLQDHYNKPVVVERSGNLDALVRGLATQRSQMMDLEFIPDVTQQLYRSDKYGMDALSLDIQRGRDHGLPPYVDYRQLCGLKTVQEFNDLLDYIPAPIVNMLKSIYNNVHDIDVLVGALAEKPVTSETLLGPTLTCLINEQMLRTATGDRYFYTNTQKVPSSFVGFTQKQLNEIKKSTLARIFCDNGDNIQTMQTDVFSVISERNPLVNCDDLTQIKHIDLTVWKET